MFHCFSARNFVILMLVLGLCCGLALSQDDEPEEEEEAPEEATEAEPEPEPPTEMVAIADPIPPSDSELTLEECDNPGNGTKSICCKDVFDIDDSFMKCMLLHQKKMPKKNEKNPAVLIKFVSCLLECVFKAKKYIGKGDTLNQKMIKSDANKLYKDDEKRRDYMIAMYEHCERHGALQWHKLKSHPAARVILTGACKPYLMFVFLCTMEYAKTNCPYYRWKGTKENEPICESMKEKCLELYV